MSVDLKEDKKSNMHAGRGALAELGEGRELSA